MEGPLSVNFTLMKGIRLAINLLLAFAFFYAVFYAFAIYYPWPTRSLDPRLLKFLPPVIAAVATAAKFAVSRWWHNRMQPRKLSDAVMSEIGRKSRIVVISLLIAGLAYAALSAQPYSQLIVSLEMLLRPLATAGRESRTASRLIVKSSP